MGFSMGDPTDWMKKALARCANYELRFNSTSRIAQGGMMVERSYNSKIMLTAKEGSNPEIPDVLYGQTHGNITDVQLKCVMPNVQVSCAPGSEIDSGFKAWARNMELKHREFYLDNDEVVHERIVGEDKLPLELSGDAQTIMMIIKIPNGPAVPPFPFAAGGLAFATAHIKDSVFPGQIGNVKIERTTRGAYPVMFQFTYADSGKMQTMLATDSTDFKLVHTPKKPTDDDWQPDPDLDGTPRTKDDPKKPLVRPDNNHP
jgi:hypothetical protein